MVQYEKITAEPASLKGLFDFLGEPFDLAAIESVLGTRHSY